MKRYDVLIIGGGAAGLAAAVSARKENSEITIGVVEKNDRIAKKIHATGNGRCNYTNMDIKSDYFYGEKAFVESVLDKFGTEDALAFFYELGIMHRVEDGRVYPISNQASAIADCLRLYLIENGVDFITDTFVSSIEVGNGGEFYVNDLCAKKVIVATGGMAQPNLGSDGSGYKLLEKFGHKMTKTKPALVSLKTETDKIKGLKGVKVYARVTLMDKKSAVASDYGEVLFTDYGLSGIPVMQVSRFYERGMTMVVDMLPSLNYDEVMGEIYQRVYKMPEREGCELFSGMVNKKIAVPMLKAAGVASVAVKAKNFTDENIRKCTDFLKKLKLTVTGDNGFNNAQVSAGGIETEGFNPDTMESKLVPNLYAAGEILDVDAICGGYNLHWAWATGFLAGKSACKKTAI
ncbi:MAG: aminoacetone oxidase family FAD-binding enzyme [Clostridia bacterium]|nr:aminoacetone oxidase family FAD-binding enzyme [Clostridia bacterium]